MKIKFLFVAVAVGTNGVAAPQHCFAEKYVKIDKNFRPTPGEGRCCWIWAGWNYTQHSRISLILIPVRLSKSPESQNSYYNQCCGAGLYFTGSGSGGFGRLRLQ